MLAQEVQIFRDMLLQLARISAALNAADAVFHNIVHDLVAAAEFGINASPEPIPIKCLHMVPLQPLAADVVNQACVHGAGKSCRSLPTAHVTCQHVKSHRCPALLEGLEEFESMMVALDHPVRNLRQPVQILGPGSVERRGTLSVFVIHLCALHPICVVCVLRLGCRWNWLANRRRCMEGPVVGNR